MVPSIDLKPLSDETIQEMGYNNHDLWMVKLGSVVFGPYETESLKHYVHENEHLFEEAEASRADEKEWKPFWAHTKFQRRKLKAVSGQASDGPFWLMDAGLKVGPFHFKEIDKKIEMGLLVMTDHISADEGHSWVKIYEIEGFDRRSHSPDDLPLAPLESSFQKARLALVDKIETPHLNTTDELAEMAWSGQQEAQVIQLKIEELTLRHEKSTEVSGSLKWAIPTAAALVLTLATTGYYVFNGSSGDAALVTEDDSSAPSLARPARGRAQIPGGNARIPASASYSQRYQQPSYNENRYPTYTETHDQHYDNHEPDPIEQPMNEMEQSQEHSLVGNAPDGGSLDAAMNGVDQPAVEAPQPVIEEASDF